MAGVPCSSTTRVTVSMIPLKGSAPLRKAATHSSLAALNTAGLCPRAALRVGARFTEEGLVVQREEPQVEALLQSKAGAASGTRSGQLQTDGDGPAPVRGRHLNGSWIRR